MVLANKYRLYPDEAQKALLDNTFGCCRMLYNLALEYKILLYKSYKKTVSAYDILYELKYLRADYPWLAEVSSHALQHSVHNLDKAYKNFFKQGAGFPKFKSRRGKQSFKCPDASKIKINGDRIQIPKFKEGIKFVESRKIKGKILYAHVEKTPTGKYYISVTVNTDTRVPEKKPITSETSVGIDLGIKTFIVTSKNDSYESPKYLQKSEQSLKVLSRRAARKKRGSANQKRAYKRVALLHEKVSNQRKDFLHKVSSEITNRYDTICMEDLRVENMVKNHNLAKSISDAGWGMLEQFIKYKCEWRGKNILQIPTFEPSTKVCSCCGVINNTLTLRDREWTCASCGTFHDRDHNAAKVIEKYCLEHSGGGTIGEPVELLTLVGAKKQEDFISVQ